MSEFKDCPFNDGDIVYHAVDGKGRIAGRRFMPISPRPGIRPRRPAVDFDSDTGRRITMPDTGWGLLSFEPWPAAVHKRPRTVGVWVTSDSRSGYTRLSFWDGKSLTDSSGVSRTDAEVFHRWIATTWDAIRAED